MAYLLIHAKDILGYGYYLGILNGLSAPITTITYLLMRHQNPYITSYTSLIALCEVYGDHKAY